MNTKIENTDVKISLTNENLDKGKSILGAPPKLDKKEAKNTKAKKANSQKPKQKKQHLCYHCGAASHTRLNCYKWLATQQSNDMIASRSQISFNLLLLLSVIFSRPSCSFWTWTVLILLPHHQFKGLIKGKVLPRCGRKRTLSDLITFFYLLVFVCCITYVFLLLF